jgi:hypothetical protein
VVPPSFAVAQGDRLVLRDIGRTRPARVRPSPSRVRSGSQPMARPLCKADGGVLLTVSAVRGSLPPEGTGSAGALERDAQTALGPLLDLHPFPLDRGDRGGNVHAVGVRGAEDELAGLAQAEGHAADALLGGE